MSVKLVEKTKSKAKVSVATTEIEQMVDEFIQTKQKVDELKAQLAPLNKALAELDEKLQAQADEMAGTDQKVTLKGTLGEIVAGQRSMVTVVDDVEQAAQALNAIEDNLFLMLAKVGVQDLRKYLTPHQLEQVTSSAREGKRSLKVLSAA